MISIKIKLNFFINIRKWNFLFAFVVDQVVATALGSDRPGKTGCRHSFSLCEQSETKVSRQVPGVKNTSYKSMCACVREGPGVSYSLRMHLSPDI